MAVEGQRDFFLVSIDHLAFLTHSFKLTGYVLIFKKRIKLNKGKRHSRDGNI